MAFLSIGLISFVLYFVLLKQRSNESLESMNKKDKAGLKKLKAELKTEKWSWQNLLMSKWISFGGGFYGVMAVLTYLWVELIEVVEFLTSEGSIAATLADLNVGDLINLFINSIMNFIVAITWPVYWMNKVEGQSIWLWFLVLYAGYVTGQFIAKNSINPHAENSNS